MHCLFLSRSICGDHTRAPADSCCFLPYIHPSFLPSFLPSSRVLDHYSSQWRPRLDSFRTVSRRVIGKNECHVGVVRCGRLSVLCTALSQRLLGLLFACTANIPPFHLMGFPAGEQENTDVPCRWPTQSARKMRFADSLIARLRSRLQPAVPDDFHR